MDDLDKKKMNVSDGVTNPVRAGYLWIDRFSIFYLVFIYVSLFGVDFVDAAVKRGDISPVYFTIFCIISIPLGVFSHVWIICRYHEIYKKKYPRLYKFQQKYSLLMSFIIAGIFLSIYAAIKEILFN